MQVQFDIRQPDSPGLRRQAERRLRFVTRRLRWLVPQARIQLRDINGPRGGVDKRCQVELRTSGAGTIVVTAVARHWHEALDRALNRAARSLVRAWRRARMTQQHRAGLPAST